MAKGKKKGGGKSTEPSESSVPSEPAPSTSTSATNIEDSGDTTGKLSKKELRQQKKAAKHETPFLKKESTPETPSNTSAVPSEAASRVQSEAPSEPPKPSESKTEEVADDFEGLCLGKAKKSRKKKKPSAAASEDASETGSAQLSPHTPAVPVPQTLQTQAPTSLVAQETAQAIRTNLIPPETKQLTPPVLTKLVPPHDTAPSSAPSVAPAWGRGKGRGRGMPPPGVQPTAPISPPGVSVQPPVMHPGPSGFQPQPTRSAPSSAQSKPIVTPIYPVAQRQPQAPTASSSRQEIMCRFKIPQKIPVVTIPSRKILVITNYLQMRFKELRIARYDISFTPDRPKKMLPLAFQKLKSLHFPNELVAFDQMKNCYSLRPLPNVTETKYFHTTVELLDTNKKAITFDVSVKFTGMVDLGKIKNYMQTKGTSLAHPTEEIQCIDVILRQGALESYVKAGRQFFKRPNNPIDLGHGFEMWTGLFQSAIFTDKAFINIDVAHKGFPRVQNLVDALVKDFRLDTSRPIESQRSFEAEYFVSFLKGLRVVATLIGTNPVQTREFIVNELVASPDKQTFTLNDPQGKNRKITVADYFSREKRYAIKYPRLNCVWVGPRDKNIYFPMELLSVVGGQAMNKQLNDVQVAKMVREAATPPDERLRKITEVKSAMRYSQNESFKKFGLEISDQFYEVEAKILNPPTLDTGKFGPTKPMRGQWQANSLLKPKPLESWGFLAVDTDPRNDYDLVINMLMDGARKMGMSCANPSPVFLNARMQELHNILQKSIDEGVKLLFIVVSSRGRDNYHKVKQMAELHVGILTQCIREQTTRRMNAMTAKNILLKVNSKLMGINQGIEVNTLPRCLQRGGVMIVGADVTHPSPDQSNVPSIAAVTASLDPKCYIYNIELSVQTPKKEVIVEFEDMMLDHLKLYKEKNHDLPHKIFVFRDGVSEGQFAQVMNSELQAIHDAYQKLSGGARRPEVLFLLVQKRHHTRLFLKGRNQNVEPGTVVDKDITHPSELDFYLVSHHAIKGTARPTRYHCVCNEGKIPDDEVEQLTYYLCHLYSRCMRSVSYPTPTYYAHLACLRARSLTYGEKFNNMELEKKPRRLHVLDKMLQFSRMFFV